MELVKIGVITKPQALKGEFRVKPSISNLKLYKKLPVVVINNIEYTVDKVVIRDTFVIFKVASVDTCEQAEALRNIDIFAYIDSGKNDTNDYLDYNVLVSDKTIGKVVDMNNYGATDIISIEGEKSIMLPIIDGLIASSDRDNRILHLNSKIYEQVVVYED